MTLMEQLPYDVWTIIFRYLDFHDKLLLRETSKGLKYILDGLIKDESNIVLANYKKENFKNKYYSRFIKINGQVSPNFKLYLNRYGNTEIVSLHKQTLYCIKDIFGEFHFSASAITITTDDDSIYGVIPVNNLDTLEFRFPLKGHSIGCSCYTQICGWQETIHRNNKYTITKYKGMDKKMHLHPRLIVTFDVYKFYQPIYYIRFQNNIYFSKTNKIVWVNYETDSINENIIEDETIILNYFKDKKYLSESDIPNYVDTFDKNITVYEGRIVGFKKRKHIDIVSFNYSINENDAHLSVSRYYIGNVGMSYQTITNDVFYLHTNLKLKQILDNIIHRGRGNYVNYVELTSDIFRYFIGIRKGNDYKENILKYLKIFGISKSMFNFNEIFENNMKKNIKQIFREHGLIDEFDLEQFNL